MNGLELETSSMCTDSKDACSSTCTPVYTGTASLESLPAETTESVAMDTKTTSFIEMSTLEPRPIKDRQAPFVSSLSPDPKAKAASAEDQVEILAQQVFPQTTQAFIRVGMTLLFVLLVPAAVLTIISSPDYALVLTVAWIIVLGLFAGLILVVRSVNTNRRIFHPYIHAVADAVVQEWQDFRSDWNESETLLLENEHSVTVATTDASSSPGEEPKPRRRRAKSRVFRAVVQPFLPFFRRRRKRRAKQAKAEGSTALPETAAGAYIPPAKNAIV